MDRKGQKVVNQKNENKTISENSHRRNYDRRSAVTYGVQLSGRKRARMARRGYVHTVHFPPYLKCKVEQSAV